MTQSIILDTDMDTDCDDAGALAVLHNLINTGECHLLGIICSVPIPPCVGAARAINAWYARPEIPIGLVAVDDYLSSPTWQPYRQHRIRCQGPSAGNNLYNDLLARTRPADDPPPGSAVPLYRRLLASAPDASVNICAIGTLTALAQLLTSQPDQYIPLTGRDLVRQKVRELISMAAAPNHHGHQPIKSKIYPN